MVDVEEHYILRVQDKTLAERLRKVLRADPEARPEDANMEVAFESEPPPPLLPLRLDHCLPANAK